ncbi:MAG TPA: PAS domain-containing protein [Flavipsychrobacter sp.]|nr:PAS domain-containing protein [Flavipsychrobacter sp.]
MNQLFDFLINLFKHSDFQSFWKNGNWTSFHGWLYIISDLMVWSAYFVLPALIVIYLRKQGKKIHFNGLYVLFATFILISGATYFIDALMFWLPLFRVSALMRLATGVISWVTIYYVFKILPTALSLKSPLELQEEIDKRIHAENTLRQQHDRLLEAERTAKLGYGLWDIFRKHVDLSDMAYEILGLSPGAILTYEKLAAQVHPADLRFIEDSIQKNLRASSFKQFYFRVLTDRMIVKHVLVRGEVIRNAAGHAIQVKGTLQDVTEMRSHLQRIEQQNKRLRKIAWVQSHRMRSPVATILGLTDLFNFDDPSDPMNAEILSSIKEQTKTLDEMIHEVDELTREKVRETA